MKKGESKYNGKYQKDEQVGLWTIISEHPFPEYKIYKSYCVNVKCKCGETKIVPCDRLEYGRSSGCKQCKLTGKGNYYWTGVGDIPGKMLSRIKNSAKKRNIKYNVSGKYLWDIFLKQNSKCALTGEHLTFHSSHLDKNTASLDRIDSSIGYVEGNVMWVHKDVNMMKHVLDVNRLVDLCEKVYVRRKEIRNRNFWGS